MRYFDTGSRDPKQALGSWLGDVLLGSTPVAALRVQTGYFGSDALGYFESTLQALNQSDGYTRLLIGSNDGLTPRAAVADLLKIAGQPRNGLAVGVVSFQSGLFHPKVFHFERADGSATAYVGSANLTGSGATSLNVEAGMIVDTAQGDPRAVLDSIADAIDAWFTQARPGLYEVATDADLDALVSGQVLGVPAPPRPPRKSPIGTGSGQKGTAGPPLRPLVAMPAIQTPLTPKPQGTPAPIVTGPPPASTTTTTGPAAAPAASPATPTPPTPSGAVKHWGKKVSASDAQRKKKGNQRGAITLVQGDYQGKIDQTIYFRHDLFASQAWTVSTSNTGQPVESATVPMHTTIDGTYHKVLDFKVTNAPNRTRSNTTPSRPQERKNYTAELHIAPVSSIFRQTDVTNRHLDIALDANGEYWLTIA